jgi:hypothetical protein
MTRLQKWNRVRKYGDLGTYLLEVGEKTRALTKKFTVALTAAEYYENQKHRDKLRADLEAHQAKTVEMIAALTGSAKTVHQSNGAKTVPLLT